MPQLDLHTLVTIALLREGADAHAARHLKKLMEEEPEAVTIRRVAERVFPQPADVQPSIDRALASAERAIRRSRAAGYRMLPITDPAYPPQLAQIVDPPPVLWVAGDPAVLSNTSVGVVGARAAAPMSLLTARALAKGLAAAGLVVTSGLARGVDGAAHEGALEAPGLTVAVMGSGLGVVYPARHEPLAARIAGQGAIVTELPPGTPAFGRHFPLRNRIISGLSRAVVIVEASLRSGSLITARMALDQNRDVLAVPGNPLSGTHRGGHGLIKDGARLVETVGDVLEEIGWSPARADTGPSGPLGPLEATMALGEAYSVDDLASTTGRPMPDLLVELGELELAGRVIRLGGGQYARVAEPAAAGE